MRCCWCWRPNRGLCAGYKRQTSFDWPTRGIAKLREEPCPKVQLEVCGKRGISAFRFRKIQPDESFTPF